MTMENWFVVKSRSGKHKEFGYPIGEILVQSREEIDSAIKNHDIHDPVIIPYLEYQSKHDTIGPEQHTAEWFAMRKKCVTSSDAAFLMGVQYDKRETLQTRWEQKKGSRPEQVQNEAMRQGSANEEIARMMYEVETKPVTLIHPDFPGFMTSLDGLSDCGKVVLEIKAGQTSFRQAKENIIPPYYYAQCQWHLFVSGLDEIQYVCFDAETLKMITIKIPREESYIEEMKERALAFLECIENNIPPGDVPVRTDISIECPPECVQAMEMYIQLDRIEKEAAEKKKDFRNALIDLGDDGDFVLTHGGIPRIKLKRTKGGSKTDWQAICNELKPSEALLRKHTKDTIGHYVLSICKEK
jgi:putative phage-type endonuclease